MIDYQETIDFYEDDIYTSRRSDIYAVPREDFFDGLSNLLADFPISSVLDIGAGPGLEAKMFAARGYRVTVVEPCKAFRNIGQEGSPDPKIEWVDDRLPNLQKLTGRERGFDLVFSSAMFMHIHPDDQEQAFLRMMEFLSDQGILYMTVRNGPSFDSRKMYPVSYDLLSQVAQRQGKVMRILSDVPDHRGRIDVTWTTLVITAS